MCLLMSFHPIGCCKPVNRTRQLCQHPLCTACLWTGTCRYNGHTRSGSVTYACPVPGFRCSVQGQMQCHAHANGQTPKADQMHIRFEKPPLLQAATPVQHVLPVRSMIIIDYGWMQEQPQQMMRRPTDS